MADNLFNSSANYRSAVVHGNLTPLRREEAECALVQLSDALIPDRSTEVRASSRKELAATLTIALPIEPGRWTVKVRDAPPSEGDRDPGCGRGGAVANRCGRTDPRPVGVRRRTGAGVGTGALEARTERRVKIASTRSVGGVSDA